MSTFLSAVQKQQAAIKFARSKLQILSLLEDIYELAMHITKSWTSYKLGETIISSQDAAGRNFNVILSFTV